MPLPADKWDMLPLQASLQDVETFFRKHDGKNMTGAEH